MAKWQIQNGDWYISKQGYDTIAEWNNAGFPGCNSSNIGKMEYPFKTFQKVQTTMEPVVLPTHYQKVVIGSGLYINESRDYLRSFSYVGDGLVIFDGSYPRKLQFTGSESLENVEIRNYKGNSSIGSLFIMSHNAGIYSSIINVRCFDGSVFYYFTVNENYNPHQMINCVLVNIMFSTITNPNYYVSLTAVNTTFINCKHTTIDGGHGIRDINVKNCIFINCKLNINQANILTFNHNNIIGGEIKVGGPNAYTVYDQEGLKEIGVNLNGISSDPLFNLSTVFDYTLQPGSPCLYAGEFGAHIGAHGVGHSFNAQQLFTGSTTSNLTLLDNRLILLNEGTDTGFLEKEINLNKVVKLSVARMFAAFQYNSLDGSPEKFSDFEVQTYKPYIPIRTYYTGDTCSYDNGGGTKKYRCLSDSGVATAPVVGANWEEVTLMPDKTFQYDFLLKWGVTQAEMIAAPFRKFVWGSEISY